MDDKFEQANPVRLDRALTMSDVVSPEKVAAALTELWSPRVVAELDDSFVKVAKVHGSLTWHSHDNEDELFYILNASEKTPAFAKGKHMAWVVLVVAGLFEVGWAIGLKYTEGFTRLWPTVGTVVAMIISLWLLGVAMKSLPVGTAYSVWVGVGAVGTVALGIVLLGEPANAARLISVALIVAGIVGLKLATPP
jgi:quaternary ammonium compound-resistance protein SugE